MYHSKALIRYAVCLTLSLVGAGLAFAQDDDYTAVTTDDALVPVDELALLVKPLLKSQLEGEAAAWIVLVQEKSQEVVEAEITIKRQSAASLAAEIAADALDEAMDAMDVAGNDAESQEKADEAMAEAQEAIEETVAASERVEDAPVESDNEGAAEALDEVVNDTGSIAASAEAAEELAEAATEEKVQLLDDVNLLRNERTGLIERTRVVLSELDEKGGDTEESRLYLTAVSDVEVDVTDWDAVKATAQGWFFSEQGGIRWLTNIARFFGVIIGFWFLSMLIGRIVDRMMKSRHSRNMSVLMRNFVSKMVRRLVVIVGIIVALIALEVDTGPLVAAIGAAGFVVAFALQDSLSNLASGIMILLYRPFDVGDVVETGGVSGKVNSLNLVSVGIKTFDNKQVLVPNNSVWHDVIVNATGVRERRVDMIFGIGYGDDMDAAQTVLERVVEEHPKVLSTPEPVIKVHELADSSVNYVCRPWVKTSDYWDVYWDVTRQVKEEFDRAGISIPFPQQDVHMHQVNPEA